MRTDRLPYSFARGCLAAIALIAAFTAITQPAAAQPPEGFVTAQGDSFGVVSGGTTQPWRPVGYNQYRLTSAPGGYACDGGYGEVSDQKLAAWLDQIRAAGATVVRTWFFQSQFDPDGTGPGEGDFAAFDRVIQAAAERGMKVVPVLANNWADCEYAGAAKDASFYESGFRSPGYGYSLSYRDYARTLAAHYASEPAIAFWQLVNEAEAPNEGGGCDEARAASALRGFAAEMTAELRSADPNHLVSLGTMGSGQCGTANGDYRAVHEPVDICEYHDYDFSGDARDDAAAPIPGDEWNGLAKRLEQCGPGGLDKPLFVGEAGISDEVPLERRAAYFAAKLEAQFAAGVDGYALWDKVLENAGSPAAPGAHEGYGIGYGDPTEDVTRAYGEAWEGTAEPWTGDRGKRRCKGKGRRSADLRGRGRRCKGRR